MNSDKRLWGARFRTPPDPAMMRLSRAEGSCFRLRSRARSSACVKSSEYSEYSGSGLRDTQDPGAEWMVEYRFVLTFETSEARA